MTHVDQDSPNDADQITLPEAFAMLVSDLQNPMAAQERMQELAGDVRTIFEVTRKTAYPILLEVGRPSQTLLLTAGTDAVVPPIGLLVHSSDLSRRWALYQLLRAQQREKKQLALRAGSPRSATPGYVSCRFSSGEFRGAETDPRSSRCTKRN